MVWIKPIKFDDHMECRRSLKWWHRLFGGFLDIAFNNSYIIYCKSRENVSTLEFRRSMSIGLIDMKECADRRRKSGTLKPIVKHRRYNSSVSDKIHLGNRGNHWVFYDKNRDRCECGIFLYSNEKKNCFIEYHEIT